MSLIRLLKLIAALLLLIAGIYLVNYAANKTYTAYPTPANEDCRRAKLDGDSSNLTHFGIAELASFDGITIFPAPGGPKDDCDKEEALEADVCEVDEPYGEFDEPGEEPVDPEVVDEETVTETYPDEAKATWVLIITEAKAACVS